MFWERFDNLCEKFNTSPNPVGKEVGVSSGLITSWKKGAMPNADTLVKIARYFNVSTDYLLNLTDNPASSKKELTLDEEIAAEYFKMSANEREQLKEYMEFLKIKKARQLKSTNE